MFLTDKNGINRIGLGSPYNQGVDVSVLDCFIKAANGVVNVSDPVFSGKNKNNESIIIFCAPVFENNNFLGTCCMIYTTESIVGIMSKPGMGETGYACLLNKEGLVLMHPEPEFILKHSLFEFPATHAMQEIVKSRQPGVAGILLLKKLRKHCRFKSDGDDRMGSSLHPDRG